MVDHVMSGVASVVGEFSKLMLKEKARQWDANHMKKWLIREDAMDLMTLKYEEISIDEHYARLYGPRILVHEHKINEIIAGDAEGDDSTSSEEKDYMRVSSFKSQPSKTLNSQTSTYIERKQLQQAFSSSPYERFKSKSYRDQDSEDSILDEIKNQRAARTKAIWTTALAKAKAEANATSLDKDNGPGTLSNNERPKSLFTFGDAADKLLESSRANPTKPLKRGKSCHGDGLRLRQVYREAFLQHRKEANEGQRNSVRDSVIVEEETTPVKQENNPRLEDSSNEKDR